MFSGDPWRCLWSEDGRATVEKIPQCGRMRPIDAHTAIAICPTPLESYLMCPLERRLFIFLGTNKHSNMLTSICSQLQLASDRWILTLELRPDFSKFCLPIALQASRFSVPSSGGLPNGFELSTLSFNRAWRTMEVNEKQFEPKSVADS